MKYYLLALVFGVSTNQGRDKLLVIGTKYNFTELELQRLNRHINSSIINIPVHLRPNEDVISDIEDYLKNSKTKVVVLNLKQAPSSELIQYLTRIELTGIKYFTFDHFMEQILHKCFVPDNDLNNLSFLTEVSRFSKWQYFQKRLFDITAVISLFLFTWPILLFAALRVKKESPGPIFFQQSRIGLNGKPFMCAKFRSMHVNSHFDPYTQKNDTRIFPFGNFMRKTRIDELPQMWNVLKGEMHFIGPRAEWDILVQGYEKAIPYYSERHVVCPGITGWAQVHYPYGQNEEDTRQKLMYDLYYIKHWNLVVEFLTIWKTIEVVLGRKGL